MIGEFIQLATSEAGSRLRGCASAAVLAIVTGFFFVMAIGLGTAAAFVALSAELGAAWTAALLAAVFLAMGLVALSAMRMGRRRRVERQLALARARAAATPTMSPEMMLLAAAAGALFGLGGGRRSR